MELREGSGRNFTLYPLPFKQLLLERAQERLCGLVARAVAEEEPESVDGGVGVAGAELHTATPSRSMICILIGLRAKSSS